MTSRLSNSALGDLGGRLNVPGYDRSRLTPGIIHIGVGNFHRAHQARYLDQLFEMKLDHDWAIVGAGVRETDAMMRDNLARQDWLSTVIELDPDAYSARVCGAMIDFLEVRPDRLIEALSKPEIRIVSLTVTEGGYFIDAKTGGFDASHADVAHDAAHPEAPVTVFGILIAALARRRKAGIPSFTVMSCDNLPENGNITRQTVLGMARRIRPDLVEWIAGTVAFPNSMVDCITPATGARERALVTELYDIEDPGVVVCEPFHQWVIEDHFPAGRPALEKVGVQFVPDVVPFETMKIRILNGGHALIAYAAGLLDIEYVHQAMQNPLVRGFLDKVEREEIIPMVPPVPDTDLDDYYQLIVGRFSNPKIGDTVRRLCLDGSNRQPKFILPSAADNLAAGRDAKGLALASALWCRYCFGETESGAVIAPNDPDWHRLRHTAHAARKDPACWLAMEDIYGDLGSSTPFRESFSKALDAIWSEGTAKVLQDYVRRA